MSGIFMHGGEANEMDLMIGTVDSKRLRRALLQRYRTSGNARSPATKNKIYTVETADEQQLIAMAKKEGMDLRPYIR